MSFVPAAVAIQGIARFAVSACAVVDAILLIRDGGDTVPKGSVITCSVVIVVVCDSHDVLVERPARDQ